MPVCARGGSLDGPMEIGHWRGRGEKSILDIRSLCSLTYSRLASSVRAAPPSRRSVINDSSDESYLKKVFLVQQNRKFHISAMRLQLSECECDASDELPSRGYCLRMLGEYASSFYLVYDRNVLNVPQYSVG